MCIVGEPGLIKWTVYICTHWMIYVWSVRHIYKAGAYTKLFVFPEHLIVDYIYLRGSLFFGFRFWWLLIVHLFLGFLILSFSVLFWWLLIAHLFLWFLILSFSIFCFDDFWLHIYFWGSLFFRFPLFGLMIADCFCFLYLVFHIGLRFVTILLLLQ